MPLSNLGTKIYSLSTQNGRTIGIMETSEYGKICDVQHLETQLKGLYGYSGSTLLSFLAQEKLKQNISSIFVSNPAKSAKAFYKDHCFFKNSPPIALELDKKIILVKLHSNNSIPTELLGEKREDVVGLELEKVKKAISNLMVH